jgi:hypothetical protein
MIISDMFFTFCWSIIDFYHSFLRCKRLFLFLLFHYLFGMLCFNYVVEQYGHVGSSGFKRI